MYLVDTSVWIDYIIGIDTEHVAFLDQLLLNPLAVGLSELIYMEILQGAIENKLILLHNDKDFRQMASVITTLEHKCFV